MDPSQESISTYGLIRWATAIFRKAVNSFDFIAKNARKFLNLRVSARLAGDLYRLGRAAFWSVFVGNS